ncbi:hypothetical protein ACFL4C_01640 [Candidatus Omnitrophota bacterium]
MYTKKILSTEDAHPYISPYVDLINRLITNAVNSYKDIPPLIRLMDSARTRSSSISDRILWNISHCEELLADSNIKIRRRYGAVRLLIKDRVQLVFKKLNNNLMPSRPSSPRSLGFLNQCDDVRKEFPGLSENVDPVTNLYWGYIWNPLSDTRTPIVCLDGSQLMWHFESVQTADTTEIVELQSSSKKTKRIRPRNQQKNKKNVRGDINGKELSQS